MAENLLMTDITLNWYDNGAFTEGLREIFKKKRKTRTFITMRLGDKWARRLIGASSSPIGNVINISISNDPEKPNVIGQAMVASVRVGYVERMTTDRAILAKNIGAKTWRHALKDMANAYDIPKVSPNMILTVMELLPI